MVGCDACKARLLNSKGLRLFRFPRDPERRSQWQQICRKKNWAAKDSSHLCDDHFEQNQYEMHRADGWIKLKPNALPSIPTMPDPNHAFFAEKVLEDSKLESTIESTALQCCILDCSSSYTSTSLSFFEIPKTYIREKWLDVIQNLNIDESASPFVVICSKHFHQEDIVCTLRKKFLRGTAVPSIFSDYFDTLSNIHERNSHVVKNNNREGRNDPSTAMDDDTAINISPDRDIVCRVCAQCDDTLTSLFGDECTNKEIPSKIAAYLPITVVKNDKLSHVICQQCITALMSWHIIYERALSANVMMQNMIVDVKKEEDETDISQNIANIVIEENQSQEMNDVYLTSPDEMSPFDKNALQSSEEKENLPTVSKSNESAKRGRKKRKKPVLPDVPSIQCDICGKLFKTKMRLNEHKFTHEFSREFRCVVCDMIFQKKKDLECHLISEHHSLYTKQSKRGDNQSDKKLSNPKLRAPCSFCCRTFSNKFWLGVHVEAAHKNGLRFVCDVCDHEFQTEAELEIHVDAENHKVDMVKVLTCTICEVDFESRLRYRRHLAENHNVGLPCNLCPIVCTTEEELLTHSAPHPRRKYLTCQYCSKKFTWKSDFSKHVRNHLRGKTGAIPYLCEICGKDFNDRMKLIQHANTHIVERKYACPICGERFKKVEEARKHRRGHSSISKSIPIKIEN